MSSNEVQVRKVSTENLSKMMILRNNILRGKLLLRKRMYGSKMLKILKCKGVFKRRTCGNKSNKLTLLKALQNIGLFKGTMMTGKWKNTATLVRQIEKGNVVLVRMRRKIEVGRWRNLVRWKT